MKVKILIYTLIFSLGVTCGYIICDKMNPGGDTITIKKIKTKKGTSNLNLDIEQSDK